MDFLRMQLFGPEAVSFLFWNCLSHYVSSLGRDDARLKRVRYVLSSSGSKKKTLIIQPYVAIAGPSIPREPAESDEDSESEPEHSSGSDE